MKKIAVLRANAIGDFVFILPALEALRARFPGAEIVLLARHWHQRFLDGRPGPIDRVVCVPPSRGVNQDDLKHGEEDSRELDRFFSRMHGEQFDLAVQLHGGGRYSNPFTKRLGAGMSIGLRAEDAIPLDRWVPYVYLQPEVLRYLEVVSLVGASPVTFTPGIAAIDADLEESYRVLPQEHPSYVVLNANAGDPLRRWPLPKFAELGRSFISHGMRPLLTGAPEDAQRTAVLQELLDGRAVDLAGRLSLKGLAGVIRRSQLVVSNDSGPLHLAVALGTPSVGIYWYPNLLTATPGMRTRHRPVVSWISHCPHCGASFIRSRCDHIESIVSEISVAEVWSNCESLLDSRARTEFYERAVGF